MARHVRFAAPTRTGSIRLVIDHVFGHLTYLQPLMRVIAIPLMALVIWYSFYGQNKRGLLSKRIRRATCYLALSVVVYCGKKKVQLHKEVRQRWTYAKCD